MQEHTDTPPQRSTLAILPQSFQHCNFYIVKKRTFNSKDSSIECLFLPFWIKTQKKMFLQMHHIFLRLCDSQRQVKERNELIFHSFTVHKHKTILSSPTIYNKHFFLSIVHWNWKVCQRTDLKKSRFYNVMSECLQSLTTLLIFALV